MKRSRRLAGSARIMGDRPLWDAINAVPRLRTRVAIYTLACRCQELEAALIRANRRIDRIEARMPTTVA